MEVHLSSPLGIGVPFTLESVKRIQIFSHSGGYFVIGNMAAVGGMPKEVRDLVLLDSLYADFDQFDTFVKSHLPQFGVDPNDFRFTSVCTETGGTYDNNIDMEERSETWISSTPESTATLLNDMNASENLLSVAQIRNYSLIYKLSGYSHDDIPRNYFYQMLMGTTGITTNNSINS